MSADQAERPSLKAAKRISAYLNIVYETPLAPAGVEHVAKMIGGMTSCDTLSAELASAKRETDEARGLLDRSDSLACFALAQGNLDDLKRYSIESLRSEIQKLLSRKGGV